MFDKSLNRRHFMSHVAGASAVAVPGMGFLNTLQAQSKELKKKQKSLIILWMSGGPSTIDIWDMKPGHANGGEHRPGKTNADGVQINSLMPVLAKNFKNLSIVRSLTTTEGDHMRGTTLMNTGRSPNPLVDFPSIGSVLSYLNRENEADLPSFVSMGGGARGPGFLGMKFAPFTVQQPGRTPENMKAEGISEERMKSRESLFTKLEAGFQNSTKVEKDAAKAHQDVYSKAMSLVTSKKKDLFAITDKDRGDLTRYGDNAFGRGCLMARKLTEAGAVCVEVSLGGWDMHNGIFAALNRKLPEMDAAMGSLMEDLEKTGRIKDTVVVWMGDFGRTPRINQNGGRDHYPRAWSVVVGGGNIKGGQAIGATDEGGEAVKDAPVKINNLYATLYAGLGLDAKAQIRDNLGRPTYLAADKEADVVPIKGLI